MSIANTSRAVGLAAIVGAVLMLAPPRWSTAAPSRTKTFTSAAAASKALFDAARAGDRQAVAAIIGDASCGDPSRDAHERERFVEKYQQMHRLVREPGGTTILYVGAENWPFPIPLVSSKGTWRFDADAGRRELMFRRIGADEATAIEVCRVAVAAGKPDAPPANGSDPIVAYAEQLARPPGASDEAFHGYRFVVRKSGDAITIVAYPAEYRASGVMTFVVGEDGVVYERDLGPETARVARTVKPTPASGWRTAG